MNARSWFERHAQTSMGSLGRIVQAPLATLMTVAVIAIALALPLLLSVFLTNLRDAMDGWNQTTDLSVYLDKRSAPARTQAVAKQLRSRADVGAVRVITSEEALAQFRSSSGFGSALDALSDNPLPDTLVVTPASGAGAPRDMEALRAAIAAMADVQSVQMDSQWIMRLKGMTDILRRGICLTAALLGAGIVLVIGNTIRLDILNRSAEIEVMKLVGATDGFTRRPFLYSGVWYGLGGGIVALALCIAAVAVLKGPVQHLATLYGSEFRLKGLSLVGCAGVLLFAMTLGWLGSWLAATRHIRLVLPA